MQCYICFKCRNGFAAPSFFSFLRKRVQVALFVLKVADPWSSRIWVARYLQLLACTHIMFATILFKRGNPSNFRNNAPYAVVAFIVLRILGLIFFRLSLEKQTPQSKLVGFPAHSLNSVSIRACKLNIVHKGPHEIQLPCI